MVGCLVAKPGFSLDWSSLDKLRNLLSTFDTIWLSPEMGGDFFVDFLPNARLLRGLKECRYHQRFDQIVAQSISHGVDVIVTVGGDGIASYTASSIIKSGRDIGIVGFPAGTANVGPIVMAGHDSSSLLSNFRPDSIEVSCNGNILGYGFNDVIIGYSFLGTINGKWVNLDASAMARDGKSIEIAEPSVSPIKDVFHVSLNGKKLELGMEKSRIMQICISTLRKDLLYGRAVLGGLSEAYGAEHPAAIALLDKVSNDARPGTWGVQKFRSTSHLCFTEKDTISLHGLSDDACVIIDGNPFVLDSDSISFRCIPSSVKVYGHRR